VHPKDRRTVCLELTDAGRHVAAQARQVQEAFFQTLYEGIDPKDLAIWNRVRNQISDNILKL
jgi:DNA-binding MarR family transcriptional regulator